ncbi:MAG: hypothetical protein WA975_06465 [Mesorhizobium sp.]
MSQYYRQMQHGNDEARRLLAERLAREDMGGEAYDRMVSNNDHRTFRIFGVVFIVLFAVVVFAVAGLGY